MTTSISYVLKFKWCALAITAVTLLALLPQLHFWILRGSEWNGGYATLQPDEVLYSAYVNALIDGRPRRSDPSTGQDDSPGTHLSESLFSVQFVPPFVIASISRLTGVSASNAFIALMGITGFLSALSIIWLFKSVTDDNNLAAVGVLVVLCLGTLAGGQGLVGLLFKSDVKFLGLPFLRRYQPAFAFPFFFVFCTLVWVALTSAKKRIADTCAFTAGITLVILVFSYFYLWTAAAAWLVCVMCFWIVMVRQERLRVTRLAVIMSGPTLLALVAYFYLLSRTSDIDKAQVLTYTHRLDLWRCPEVLGAFTIIATIIGARRRMDSARKPEIIFAMSFAALPFLIFNQQLISGRSLQPFHYEILIVNYAVLVGLVIIARLLVPTIPRALTLLIACGCLAWSTSELVVPSFARYKSNVRDDEIVPVLRELKELANHDVGKPTLPPQNYHSDLVFSPEHRVSELLPTWAPQGSLLAPGSASFGSTDLGTRKERLYAHFYYCGMNTALVRELLSDQSSDPTLNHLVRSTIFGPERVVRFLSPDFQPIGQNEIDREVQAYEAFTAAFSKEQASKWTIGYAIVPRDKFFDFCRIDLWYERDPGEDVGLYRLYRLTLRRSVDTSSASKATCPGSGP